MQRLKTRIRKKRQQKPALLAQDNFPAWPQLTDVKEMKATDGDLSAATDYLTSLEKQAVDDIDAECLFEDPEAQIDSSDESSKVSRRTYISQVSVSVRRAPDPIEEDGFANIPDDESKRLLVAVLFGCHRLTLHQRGIFEDPYIRNIGKMERRNPVNLFNSLKMTLQRADKTKIILTLGDIIHRQPSLLGRRCVVVVCSPASRPGPELAVKIQ
ncbi:hypothetical protein EV421DRAFT_1816274 [Armillaria borealis]|uniref:Uncharacterized protein n=1 Tax=Armillaria borealis TaxID=47425 RepID=A0AA39MMI0_9AGAR|nr:hypothetical protein EV421DRAFT_1816274 [Armillaria borealis]